MIGALAGTGVFSEMVCEEENEGVVEVGGECGRASVKKAWEAGAERDSEGVELWTLLYCDGIKVDEGVVEFDIVWSRLSLGAGESMGLCFLKRDMKPFNPGPAEAGGLATGGGEILKCIGSFALFAATGSFA
jgi:hypothetical protein